MDRKATMNVRNNSESIMAVTHQPLTLVGSSIPRRVTRLDGQLTAFVLSGGGSLGAVQVGMLQALIKADIRPDFVVGTSIGALNGAFLVGHLDVEGIAALEQLWNSIHRRDVFRISPPHLVRGTFGSQNYLFSQLGLRSLISRAGLGFSRLEDAPVPIHVVATDVMTGDAVVLSEGDTIETLVASAAIPGVFAPVNIGGRTLIDGGVVANLPIRQALELGASRVFVLPAIFGGLASVPSSALDMMQHSTIIATAALAHRESTKLDNPQRSTSCPYPSTRPLRCSTLMRRRHLSEVPTHPAWRGCEQLILTLRAFRNHSATFGAPCRTVTCPSRTIPRPAGSETLGPNLR